MSAFGRAMFDQLAQPDRCVTFHMSVVGGNGEDCVCQDFLRVRPEEGDLIKRCLDGNPHPRVLDIGCGIGRHSSFVRSLSQDAEIAVVEADRELRDYTVRVVPGAFGYERFGDIPADVRFDIVLLLGNGFGVFGSEHTTRHAIGRIYEMLSARGCALIECGDFSNGKFHTARYQIEYRGLIDGPFMWGYATPAWLQRELAATGFRVISVTPSSLAGPFFIVFATRNA